MEQEFLESCLADGLSLEAIGERVGKHPSTVSYWLRKHDLSPAGSFRHSPKANVDEARLRELVEEGASIRKIAEDIGAGYSTIRYWLKRLGLETERMAGKRVAAQQCSAGPRGEGLSCPKHGRAAFFKRPNGRKCRSDAVSERRRRLKRQLVEEAGGRCSICGFSNHPAALQFHHIDPETKEFHLAQYGHSRSIDRVRAEVEKCILLCANCHAQVEVGAMEVPAAGR
jgi:transposase